MTTVPTAALLGIMIANASESSRIDKETEAVFSEKLGVDDFSIIGFSSQLERGSSNYVEVRHRAAPYDVLVKTKREGNQLEFFFYNEKRELVPATPKAFAQYAEAVDSGEFELILPRKLSHLN
ncbi:hypothetical protein E6Q11_06535 [Candidatus Dojkabacteria bacterium]|uniref:Uncharacterized protein n=1 Tax=Candidatus Dojkabacteria bacterium TaxID=2099670 RepID=A0A5C7J2U2_9BACT|nr:MAG: hypothetical protein E6Q11_06535 [Candidatus Dojkabacteria bacterium]